MPIAVVFDISMNDLLEKGIAVFFAVMLLMIGLKELRSLRRSMDAQTLTMHDCFVWLGNLIHHDKGIPPPQLPGLPVEYKRQTDVQGPGLPQLHGLKKDSPVGGPRYSQDAAAGVPVFPEGGNPSPQPPIAPVAPKG